MKKTRIFIIILNGKSGFPNIIRGSTTQKDRVSLSMQIKKKKINFLTSILLLYTQSEDVKPRNIIGKKCFSSPYTL